MLFCIDESGSFTTEYSHTHPYFTVALVRVLDGEKLRRVYRRFVSKYHDRLQELDHRNRMFRKGRFRELKGSEFEPFLKRDFVHFFAQNHYFELYFIQVSNEALEPLHCKNSSRAFNYIMNEAMKSFYAQGLLPREESVLLQLDDRNEKTESKHFLENYLNTEFQMELITGMGVKVEYFESHTNPLVQVADVFSNLFFSSLMTDSYDETISRLWREGYLKGIYHFPDGRLDREERL